MFVLFYLSVNSSYSQNKGVDSTSTSSNNFKADSLQKNNNTSSINDSSKKVISTIPKKSKKLISADFLFPEVIYEELAVISNVIRLSNNSKKEQIFTLQLSIPSGWKTLNNSNKSYTLPPGDSVFIAVRLITNNNITKGGTKYNIIAYVNSNEGNQLTATSFMAGRNKVTNWQMHVLPKPRIYFLNNENEVPFQINLSNDGDEDQQVILSMTKIGKDAVITDSLKRFIKRNYQEFNLKPKSDTTLPFIMQINKPKINIKRVDTYGYLVNDLSQEKHYSIYFKATEVGFKSKLNKTKGTKADFIKLSNSIDFVKLNNITKVNQYGSSVIPLTINANINNILGQQPVMNLVLLGNTRVNSKSTLNYFFQSGYSYYLYNKKMINNSFGLLNYNHDKYFLSVGSGVSLNGNNLRGVNIGKGISGGYNINNDITVGGYFLRNGQSFINNSNTSIGIGFGQKIKKIRYSIGLDNTTYITNNYSNSAIGTLLMPIFHNQNINLLGQYSVNNLNGANNTRNMFSINYNITYLKAKAQTGLSFSRNEGTSALNVGQGQVSSNYINSISSTLRNSYKTKNGSQLQLFNNYNQFLLQANSQSNKILSNSLLYSWLSKSNVVYIPGIYSNYSDFNKERLLSTGLQFGVNSHNFDENYRLGFNVRGGYNKLIDHPDVTSYFTANSTTYLTYRTWNLNLRYFYGPQGVSNNYLILKTQSVYSQMIAGSIGKQQQFKNKHFIWENTFNYNYLNLNKRHSIGIYSQLFYFTNKGWRFNFNVTHNYNIFNTYNYSILPGATNSGAAETSNNKQTSQSFQIGVGVKKDLAIPIPKRFRKTHFTDANFKAFLDLNGNKKYDLNEIALENVMLRLNDNEVLTNDKGEASFLNIGLKKYKLNVFSLIDIGAWFPVVTDSLDIIGENTIFIPFSQGVQILGSVHINREKYSEEIKHDLDISRLKIYLIDSVGKVITSVTDNKGDFKFYVPYGKYILKFDEKILGSGFELLQNDINVELADGIESFYHTFFIVEKKRKVKKKKFDANGNVIEINESSSGSNSKKFDSNGKQIESNETMSALNNKKTESSNIEPQNTNTTPNNTKNSKEIKNQVSQIDAKQIEELIDIMKGNITPYRNLSSKELSKIEKAKIKAANIKRNMDAVFYTIQIGAYSKGLPQNILKIILRLNLDIESYKDPKDGLTKYFTGNYSSYEDALKLNTEIRNKGLNGAFIMVVDKGILKRYKDYLESKTN